MGNVYTFVGEDSSYNLINIKNKIKELDIKDSEIINIDLSEKSISDLIEVINTPSLFVLNKIVILYGLDENFSDNNLIKYIKSPSEEVYLFISILNKKYKIYEDLAKYTTLIESNVLKEEEFYDFVCKRLDEISYTYTKEAIEELVKRSNADYLLLNNNLDKLISYKLDTKSIALKDVETLTLKNTDDNAFDLIKELIKKNKSKAYDIYLSLKKNNVEDNIILSSLIYKYREMLITKKLSLAKTSYEDMARVLNIQNPNRMYYLVKDIKNIELKEIEGKLNELLDIDYKSKIGLSNIKESLELFILK